VRAREYVLIPATPDFIDKIRAENRRDLQEIPEKQWPHYLGWIKPEGKIERPLISTEKMANAVRTLVAGLEGKTEPFHVTSMKVVSALGYIDVFHQQDGGMGDRAAWSRPDGWRSLAEHLRDILEGKGTMDGKEFKWPHPLTLQVASMGVYLLPDEDNQPVLSLAPHNTFDALSLVAARMKATGTTFNICENCNTPFLSGGNRGRNKRRVDARFCSDRCRYEWHNRRKARGK
jgi:hypothetical protein